MRTGYIVALSLVAGYAVGVTAMSSLRAQNRAPAYVITDFAEITNPAGFAEAAKGLPASLAAGGGRQVARSDTLMLGTQALRHFCVRQRREGQSLILVGPWTAEQRSQDQEYEIALVHHRRDGELARDVRRN